MILVIISAGLFFVSGGLFAAINIVECVDAAMHHEFED